MSNLGRALARRRIWADDPFRSFFARIRPDALPAVGSTASDYLVAANLRIEQIAPGTDVVAAGAIFRDVGCLLARFADATFSWPRDAGSMDRAVLMIISRGTLRATEAKSSQLLRGIVLFPPSQDPIEFSVAEGPVELTYISIESRQIEPALVGLGTAPLVLQKTTRSVLPIVGFAHSLTQSRSLEPVFVDAMRRMLIACVSSVVESAAESDQGRDALGQHSLYERARKYIAEHHTNSNVTLPMTAAHLRVSTRSLQASFAANGTTFRRDLNAARIDSALRIRNQHPRMTAAQLAEAAGFGSRSSMYRALSSQRSQETE